MELGQPLPDNQAMTFDEISMERSKTFVKALQELKNLRPQLYSAAEYCEKSYLHSEQKQMVLDNLKDYAVRALVNAVDHLGTVAYKLTDLLEQRTSDVSTTELKITCLNQQILTYQTYANKEGLRQQQLLAIIPRHHKHYILPNSINKKVHFSPSIEMDARQSSIQVRPHHPSVTPSSKTLSWHLASETKSTLKETSRSAKKTEDSKISGTTSGIFQFVDTEMGTRVKPFLSTHAQLHTAPVLGGATRTMGVTRRESKDSFKALTAFKSFGDSTKTKGEMARFPARSKSVLSAFFVKQKTSKSKRDAVS